jgi:cobalt-zinc-cadmium efflux system outer membrane protein
MRSTSMVLVVCMAAASAPGVAWAQPAAPQPEARITLAEAIAQAVARNRDIAVSRRDVDITLGRLQQARRYPFNPELGVEGEAGRGVGREESDRRGVGGGKVGLSQVVEIRGQRGLRDRAAESEVARAEWSARDTERDVVAQTMAAFSELLVAQERLGLVRQALTLATGLRDSAKALVDAGDVPEIDLLRADVEVRRAANRVTQEDAAVQRSVRALALLIGAAPDAPLAAAGPLLFDPVPGTLEELLANARANRPDVRVAEAAIESARAGLRLVVAERFVPSLTVSASYGESLEFDSRSRLVLFGVSVPLPLWNRRDGDVRAAEADVARQEADRDRILARIDKEVTTAFQQFVAARRVVEDYVRQIVPAQEQNAQLIQQGYRLGQLRLTEALLAQRDLIDVRVAYLEALGAYNATRAELQKAAGVRP